MNLNSRLTLSNILITVLPRDSLLFNEKLTVIIILIFNYLLWIRPLRLAGRKVQDTHVCG